MGTPNHELARRAPVDDTPTIHSVTWLNDSSSMHRKASRFTGSDGTSEWHIATCVSANESNPSQALEEAWLAALKAHGLSPESTVVRRVFCRDPTIQSVALEGFENNFPGAFSCIGQPVLGGDLAVWSHHIVDPDERLHGSGSGTHFSYQRGDLCHHWFSGICMTNNPDPASQTTAVLEQHDHELARRGMELSRHVVRTWWYVRDIDHEYQGLVGARCRHFEKHGLNKHTHYIASTGIAGSHPNPHATVSLDSYAIQGVSGNQIEYLNAADKLGRTDDYGVTFERATAVSYADRRHVFISGTASIDPAGNILHPGDVMRQLERAMDNIAALLAEAKAGFQNLAHILVYLRNPEDGAIIHDLLENRFPDLPMLVLEAPVCRPGWLVEVEGLAIVEADLVHLPKF